MLLVGPVLVVALWLVVSALELVNPLFVPSAFDTAHTLASLMAGGGLWFDLWLTLYRTLVGFGIATLVGIPLGLLVGHHLRLYRAFEIVIDFFRSLPGSALFPLFMLMFGVGDRYRIATAAFVSVWIILINSAYGVLHSSKLRQKAATTLGASRVRLFFDVVAMDALPQVFVGLRTALSIALVVVVVSEMFVGARFGLGQRMFDAYLTYETPKLYAVLLVTGAVGYGLSRTIALLEARLVHWAGK